jgi:hypothetical protein
MRDETIAASDRVAGLLVPLYARPPARIVQLTVDHITNRAGSHNYDSGAAPSR